MLRLIVGAMILSFLAIWLTRYRPIIVQTRNSKLCDGLVNSLKQNQIESKSEKVQDCAAKHFANNSMESLDKCEFFTKLSNLKTENDIRQFCFTSSRTDIENEIDQCLLTAGLSKEDFIQFSNCVDS